MIRTLREVETTDSAVEDVEQQGPPRTGGPGINVDELIPTGGADKINELLGTQGGPDGPNEFGEYEAGPEDGNDWHELAPISEAMTVNPVGDPAEPTGCKPNLLDQLFAKAIARLEDKEILGKSSTPDEVSGNEHDAESDAGPGPASDAVDDAEPASETSANVDEVDVGPDETAGEDGVDRSSLPVGGDEPVRVTEPSDLGSPEHRHEQLPTDLQQVTDLVLDPTWELLEPLGDPESWLNLADVPARSVENLVVKVLVEIFADLADATTFPAGQILRLAHKLSQPRITIPITTYGNDALEVHLRTAVTLDGPLLDLEVTRPGDQPAPTTPPDSEPRPNDQWPFDYFWIESSIPCYVTVLPRANLEQCLKPVDEGLGGVPSREIQFQESS